MTNQRKHTSQMSIDERVAIESYAHGLRSYTWKSNPHVIDRQKEKRISDVDIAATLRYGKVVEAHANNYPEIRFVLRFDHKGRSICVCASIDGRVITVWANNSTDHHRTLKTADYQWKVDLTRVFDTRKG